MTRYALALGILLTAAAAADAQGTAGGTTPPQTAPPAKPAPVPTPQGTTSKPTPPPGTKTPPRTSARGGNVTFAINVTDPEGNPVPNVTVKIEGATSRTTRTEGGRIALEGLPSGSYNLRFDREGFIPFERELTARAGQVVDVKVILNPLPAPPPKPAEPPPPPPKPVVKGKAAAADVRGIVDTEPVGRTASRINPISCSGEVESTVIQLNQPLAEHTHDSADEVLYVISGEGIGDVAGAKQRLKEGIYLFVPRGTPHALTKSGGKPLVVMSVRSGTPCQ